MSLTTWLLIAALTVIAILAVVAARLHYRLYRLRQKQALEQTEQAEREREQRERVNTSIRILAQALQREELTLTEASIRISMLLDSLGVGDEVRTEFSAFYQLRERTAHIPILAAWQDLDRKQQQKFERERLHHETTYGDFVLDAANRIQTRSF